MSYHMVLYVDSLEIDATDVPRDGPRICAWTNKMIRLVVDLGTKTDGSFGNLPACFRNKPSMFSSGPSVVDMFIQHHLPVNPDEEKLAQYRASVINMCNVFEDGVVELHHVFSQRPGQG